jgi:hypothetical protein
MLILDQDKVESDRTVRQKNGKTQSLRSERTPPLTSIPQQFQLCASDQAVSLPAPPHLTQHLRKDHVGWTPKPQFPLP